MCRGVDEDVKNNVVHNRYVVGLMKVTGGVFRLEHVRARSTRQTPSRIYTLLQGISLSLRNRVIWSILFGRSTLCLPLSHI